MDTAVWRITRATGRLARLGCLVSLCALWSAPLVAQGSAGEIEGTIRDEQSGVLPGVSLTLRNQVTGVSRTMTTEDDGRFVFAALAPGRYTLRAELSGFGVQEVADIVITIGLELASGHHAQGAGAGRERDDSRRVADRRHDEGRDLRHGHAAADRDAAAQLAAVSVAGAARARHDRRRDAVVLRHGQRRRLDDLQRHRQRRRRHDQQLGRRRRAAAGSAGRRRPGVQGHQRRLQGGVRPGDGRRRRRWSPSPAPTTFAARRSSTSATRRSTHAVSSRPKSRTIAATSSAAASAARSFATRCISSASFERTDTEEFYTVRTGQPQFYSSLEGTFPLPSTRNLYSGARRLAVEHHDQSVFVRYPRGGRQEDVSGLRRHQRVGPRRGGAAPVAGPRPHLAARRATAERFPLPVRVRRVLRLSGRHRDVEGDRRVPAGARRAARPATYSFPSLTYGNNYDYISPESRWEFRDTYALNLGDAQRQVRRRVQLHAVRLGGRRQLAAPPAPTRSRATSSSIRTIRRRSRR